MQLMKPILKEKAYKNFIENMSFLNDDYNDKIAHFFVAFERYQINNRNINKKINQFKKIKGGSSLYDINQYINPPYC